MGTMTVSEVRQRLSDVVDEARIKREPVYLTRHGRPVAAIIDASQLDQLVEAAEDLADIRAAEAARQEIAAGIPAIPWEQVKRDLGLI